MFHSLANISVNINYNTKQTTFQLSNLLFILSGLCHGVAGNGYVFLLLYRLTADEKYVFRANTFAQFMTTSEFKREARTPDCPFSLYEGLAGTVCYILDLFTPKTAAFPFMDVF